MTNCTKVNLCQQKSLTILLQYPTINRKWWYWTILGSRIHLYRADETHSICTSNHNLLFPQSLSLILAGLPYLLPFCLVSSSIFLLFIYIILYMCCVLLRNYSSFTSSTNHHSETNNAYILFIPYTVCETRYLYI